jgi:hypothetical protein
VASLLLGAAATARSVWYIWIVKTSLRKAETIYFWLALSAGAVLFFWITTRLAARLTAWEAAYRGLRLPAAVVQRTMYYHAAHSLPVAVLALLVTVGFRPLVTRGAFGGHAVEYYLYALSGAVVLSAAYLFQTYWIAMRAVMYANR